MRKLALRTISALVVIVLLDSNSSGGDTKPETTNKLPSQIAEYYKAYNFVGSYSSESERSTLASYRIPNDLPNQLRTKRLERVHQLLKSLNAQVERVDPDIIVPQGDMKKKRTCKKLKGSSDQMICAEELLNDWAVMPSGLIEIDAVRQCSDSTLAVEVTSYTVAPETNSQLISQYEKEGSKIPSEEQILKMPGVRPISVKEIHRWMLFDGNWMKQEANIVLLEATIATLGDLSSAANYCSVSSKKR